MGPGRSENPSAYEGASGLRVDKLVAATGATCSDICDQNPTVVATLHYGQRRRIVCSRAEPLLRGQGRLRQAAGPALPRSLCIIASCGSARSHHHLDGWREQQ
jgi:hypothetical protein